jgi:CBS domain-containing protein
MVMDHGKAELEEITAADVMTHPVVYVMADTPLDEIAKVLLRENISAVPVLDQSGHLIGIVSEGDLVRRRSKGGGDRRSWWLDLFDLDTRHQREFLNYLQSHGLRAQDVMTRNVVVVTENTVLPKIADLLETHHIKRVPVVHDDHVAGIVSRADLLRALVHARPVNEHARGSLERGPRHRG